MEDNILQLGGNIELSGFSELDGGTMIVLKKIVGNYVKKISTKTDNFEKLSLTMKTVHNNQFEVHAKMLDNGQQFTSEIVERNLFVAIDTVLKKIMNGMGKI